MPQKAIASIIIFCLVSLVIGSVLLLPRQAQAACPVYVVKDSDSPIETAWNKKDLIHEGKLMIEEVTQSGVQLWDKAKKLVTWGVGQALNTLLHQIAAQLTNDIVNWIQNGEEPRFVSEGFGGYLEEAVNVAGGNFVENYLGLGWMCDPFDINVKTALLDTPDFEDNVTCTLDDVVGNINAFYNDFSQGGWAGWIEMNKPHNNFYGAMLRAIVEKERSENEAKEQEELDVTAGGGFLSMKNCYWYDKNGSLVKTQRDVRGTPQLPAECTADRRPCTHRCETLTPGKIVEEIAGKASINFYDQLNEMIGAATAKAGPFEVYIQAILSALVNRVMQEGVGLLKTENEAIPQHGGLGAGAAMPEITSSESIEGGEADANRVGGQLEILQKDLNEMMNDSARRITNLENAYDYYDQFTREALTTLKESDSGGYSTWAANELAKIDNSILPNIQSEIDRLSFYVSPATSQMIGNAIYSNNNFINESNNWLNTYESVKGDAEVDSNGDGITDLEEATEALNNAENTSVNKTKQVITAFNGSSSAESLWELSQETSIAINNLSDTAIELDINPNNTSELSAAQSLVDEAERYLYGYDEEYYIR